MKSRRQQMKKKKDGLLISVESKLYRIERRNQVEYDAAKWMPLQVVQHIQQASLGVWLNELILAL